MHFIAYKINSNCWTSFKKKSLQIWSDNYDNPVVFRLFKVNIYFLLTRDQTKQNYGQI